MGLLDDQLPPLRDSIGKGDLRLEGLVKAETRMRADKMLEQFEMLADKTVKLEKRHVEKTRIQDTRVDEIASAVSENNQRHTQANNSLDQKLSACVTRLDGTMKDIPVQMEKNHRQVTAYCERLDSAITEATKPIATQLDHFRQHFTERCDEVDKNLLEGLTELRSKTEGLLHKFTATSEEISRTCELDKREHVVRLDALEAGLSSASENFVKEMVALQTRFSGEAAALTDRIQGHTKHFASTVANVEQNFAEKHSAGTEKLVEVAGQIADHKELVAGQFEQLKGRVDTERSAAVERDATTTEHFRKLVKASEVRTEALVNETKAEFDSRDDAIESQAEHFTARLADLDKNLVDQVAVMSDRVEILASELGSTSGSIRHNMAENAKSTDARHVKLKDDVDANVQRLLAAFGSLQTQFTEEQTAAADRIENNTGYFNDALTNIEQKFDERNTAQDARVNELIEMEHQHFSDALVALDRKVSNEHLAQAYRLDELNAGHGTLQQNVTQICDNLDQKFSDISLAQDARIEEYYRHFTDLHASLDEKLHGERVAADELMADLQVVVTKEQDALLDVGRDVEKCKEKNIAQDERMDDLSGVIDDHHHHFTDVCAMLDTKLRDAQRVQASDVERVQAEFATMISNTEAKHQAAAETTAERIDNHHRHFTGICNQTDKNMDDHKHAVDKRTADMNTQMDANNGRFSDALDLVDQKLVDKIAGQELRLREQNGHFAEVVGNLENRFEEAGKAAQVQFNETVASMDHKLVEWTKDIDARSDEMGATINENHRHFTTVCNKLDAQLESEAETLKGEVAKNKADGKESAEKIRREAKEMAAGLTDELEALGRTVGTQGVTFSDACGRLDRMLAETAAELEAAIAQENAHFSEMSVAMDRKVTEHHNAAAGQFDEQSATIHEHHSYFAGIIRELDSKFTTATAAQVSRQQQGAEKLEKSMSMLETVLQKTVQGSVASLEKRLEEQQADFTEVFTAQDKKFSDACLALDAKFVEEFVEANRRAENDRALSAAGAETMGRQLSEQVETTNAKFTDVCIGLDEKFSTIGRDLKLATDGRVAALEAAALETAAKLAETTKRTLGDLDEKFTDTAIGLDQKLMTLLNESSGMVTKLGAKQVAENEKTRAELQSLKEALIAKHADALAVADRKLAGRAADMDGRVETLGKELSTTIQTVDKKLNDESRKIDSKLTIEVSKLAKSIATETAKVADRAGMRADTLEKAAVVSGEATKRQVGGLEEKLGEATREQKAAGTRTASDLKNLEEKADRNYKALLKRAESQQSEIQAKTTGLNSLVSTINSELAAKISKLRVDLEESSGEQKYAVEKVAISLDKVVDKQMVGLEQSMKGVMDRMEKQERTALAIGVMQGDIVELRTLGVGINSVQDTVEELEQELDARIGEMEVDVTLLQATQATLAAH